MDTIGIKDLLKCYHQCNIRGLKQSSKWAAELILSLQNNENDNQDDTMNTSQVDISADLFSNGYVFSDSKFLLAKTCFDLGEYDRAAFWTKDCKGKEARFLHFYSRYLSAEKKRLDTMAETSCLNSEVSLKLFSELRNELQQLYNQKSYLENDGYLLYVYAIVLLKLELNWEANDILVKSIQAEPLNWASWHQLAQIIDDKSQLDQLNLPNHWFKKFFLGEVYLELQLNEEAFELYSGLIAIFKDCNYILSQIAIAKHNLRDVDGAIDLFQQIRKSDPARLDSMDIYSNLLYVNEKRTELSSLAHEANSIDPFRVETCCCIANFYSLRSQHAKSVVYFSRALQLNPKHLSAWTLIGHEYMEMKNTGAAIQAYRSAIKCNKRDYRAWYGLGQTYEILKMPAYSLYYYSVAHCLRPNDSRMILATGETLEKLERNTDAIKCYYKAGKMGLYKLAFLYERLHESDKAAAAYTDYIKSISNGDDNNPQVNLNQNDLAHGYKFLADYHLSKGEYKLAQTAAQKCIQFPLTRDEGKTLLKDIQKKCPFS